MRLSDLMQPLSLKPLTGHVPTSAVCGVYVGDLLSRAMSHVKRDNLWITIMNNKNVVAVADLTEPCAIILAEGVDLLPDAKYAAEENGIAVFSTKKTAYEVCAVLTRLFGEQA